MPKLVVRGANQHNLKDIYCELPRNQLVIITGPSGCGKSSLAFDTIYAEGQRRYVESLSAYARQFLDQLPKPKVKSIEGLSPAIAIEQKALGKSPRSTVGTVTEIADYLRLLFARAGTPHCPKSGKVLHAHTVQEIVDSILALEEGSRVILLAPVLRDHRGTLEEAIEGLRRDGFVRARINGEVIDLGDYLESGSKGPHDLDVVVDRIVARPQAKGRITDSVELGLRLGDGTVLIDEQNGEEPRVMSERLVSWEFGIVLPPLEPRLFSFNSPHGACGVCDGLGTRSRIDSARVVPDPGKSLREGAVAAFGRRGSIAMATEIDRVVKVLGVDPDVPFIELSKSNQTMILEGTGAKSRRGKAYDGIIPRLEKILEEGAGEGEDQETEEGAIGPEDLGRFIVTRTCEACDGHRLREEALAVKLADRTIADLCALPLGSLRTFLLDVAEIGGLDAKKTAIAEPLIQAVTARLGFLLDVGLDYLSLDRPAQTLSGGEGQRIRLATQIGAALIGVLYVLDEPSVGLHARQRAPSSSAAAPRRQGQ